MIEFLEKVLDKLINVYFFLVVFNFRFPNGVACGVINRCQDPRYFQLCNGSFQIALVQLEEFFSDKLHLIV